MAVSYSTQRATSNGTLSTLALSISYFDRSEIEVFINDAPSTAWSWTSPTSRTIQFNAAPLPNGTTVLVRRTTDIAAVRHIYTGGAQFTYQTLDENFKQILHIAQESKEGLALGDLYNDLNMHGYKISNVGQATDPSDVVTLAQYQADASGANAAKVAAAASAADALNSQNAAATSATVATNKATDAANSAASALASRDTAQVYANTATSQANSAQAAALDATAALDAFTDLYLGAFSADPTVDNDGNVLQVGALYFNTTVNEMRVWGGTVWQVAYVSDSGFLLKNQNLADVQSVPTARSNLGLVPQTSLTDTTAGRLLTVGAFGANGGNVTEFTGDMNALVQPGDYNVTSVSTNRPTTDTMGYFVTVRTRYTGAVIQTAYVNTPLSTQVVAHRHSLDSGASWSAWTQLVTGIKQTSTTDTTPGALLSVGAFGLGGQLIPSSNLNTITTSGMYGTDSATTTGRPADGYWAVLHMGSGAGNDSQLAQAIGGTQGITYTRSQVSGTWSAWKQLVGAGDYGIGGLSLPYSTIPSNDLNSSFPTGVYHINSGVVTNLPVAVNGSLLHVSLGAGFQTQLYMTLNQKVYYRYQSSGGWSGWSQIFDDDGWQVPALVNGYVAGNGLRYRRKNGRVSIQGTVLNGNPWVANSVIFTLPAGYRPAMPVSQTMLISYGNLASQLSHVIVNTNGTVVAEYTAKIISTPSGTGTGVFNLSFEI